MLGSAFSNPEPRRRIRQAVVVVRSADCCPETLGRPLQGAFLKPPVPLLVPDLLIRLARQKSEALAEAAHVSLATIETLREHWRKTRNVNAALTWLSAFGLTYHQVSTLGEKLGNNVVAILQDDPYLVIREIRGMGFKKVDPVARKLGTPKEHLPRIRAGVLHCVQEALDQRDCWVEYEDLIDRANTLLIMDCLDSRQLFHTRGRAPGLTGQSAPVSAHERRPARRDLRLRLRQQAQLPAPPCLGLFVQARPGAG